MKSRTAALFGAMLLATCLTGCGGGGGSDGDSPPPKDISKPVVLSSTPAHKSEGLGTTSAITVVFNEEIAPATIKPESFILLKDGTTTSISGSITYVDKTKTAQFKPASLEPNTSYTATVTTGITDPAGNSLAANYSWQFTTGGAPDISAPTVLRTYPVSGATGLVLNSAIAVTFNEDLDPATIKSEYFILLKDGTTTPVAGTLTSVGTTALFKPDNNLSANASYTARVTTGVTDLAGNPLLDSYSWRFTTGGEPDNDVPRVISTSPAPDATDVAVDSAITVTFDEAVKPFYFVVSNMPGAFTFNDIYTEVSFKPANGLEASSLYNNKIQMWVSDMAGNQVYVEVVLKFSTTAP